MEFKFVDNTAIDGESRRLIRRHVMKGRNLGKSYPMRRARRIKADATASNTSSREIAVVDHTEDIPHSGWDHTREPGLMLERQLGRGISWLSLPKTLTPESNRLIHDFLCQLASPTLNPQYCIRKDIMSSGMVQRVLVDAACLNSFIALSAASLDFWRGGSRSQSRAVLQHLLLTFRMANQRLSTPDAASNSTIAVVLTLGLYECLSGNFQNALVHVDGLKTMMSLRGGLTGIARAGAREMAQKASRLDIGLALWYGRPTRFSPSEICQEGVLFQLRDDVRFETSADLARISLMLSPKTRDVLADVEWLTRFLRRTRVDAPSFELFLNRCFYRLIDIWTTCEPKANNLPGSGQLDRACCVALLAFMCTFTTEYGQTVVSHSLLSNQLRYAIHNTLQDASIPSTFLLWALFVGCISLPMSGTHGASGFEPLDYGSLPLITRTIQRLGLVSWEDVQGVLEMYPWIPSHHGKLGARVWNNVLERTSSCK
ncbi:hypothetical protein F4778DRAFT_786823 [Xylariomycetidae sp. FL2044]|nr:hypothetical protein F4778DRAFT_786823 [Xylariomycetidae sp. FL2044]